METDRESTNAATAVIRWSGRGLDERAPGLTAAVLQTSERNSRRSTRRIVLVLCCALVLLAPSYGSAQALQSFEDLALRVNLDDRVRVEDQFGVRATGHLTRLTRDEIAIRTDVGEKRFTSDTVRAVAARGHASRKGALIGAGVLVVLNAVAAATHENAGGVPGAIGAAVVGAGLGAAVGAAIPQMGTIYRAPENRASVPRSRDAVGMQASLLEDLALRVNLHDQLRVEDRSGVRTTGRLTRLTADDITIQTGTDEEHFTRETVRQIAVRRHPLLRTATLIGAGVGAAFGAWAACRGDDDSECADGPILLGGLCAGAGAVVGGLIHRTTLVYPEPEKRTSIVPAISRDAVGVRVSRRW
jgi:hypothetical protein